MYEGSLATGWSQSAELVASDRQQSDYFGVTLSLQKETLIVGSYFDDDNGFQSGS